MSKKFKIFALILLIFTLSISAQSEEKAPTNKKPVILVTLAGENRYSAEVDNGWFSAIMDGHLRLRMLALDNFITIMPDSLNSALVERGKEPIKYGLEMNWKLINAAGKGLNADLVINSFYEVEKNDTVALSFEVYSVKKNKTMSAFEGRFAAEETGYYIDSCFFTLCKTAGLEWNKNQVKKIFQDISTPDIKTMKKVGNAWVAYNRASDNKERMDTYAKLTEVNGEFPIYAVGNYMRGIAAEKEKVYEDAARAYNTLTLRNGLYYPDLYVKVLRNFRLSSNNGQAGRTILLAEKRGVNTPAFIVEKARLLKKMRKNDEALAAYKKALEVDPNSSEALCAMAELSEENGNKEEALNWYKKERKINGDSEKTLKKIVELSIALDKANEVKSDLLKLVKLDPESPFANKQLALISLSEGDVSNASKYATKVNISPNNVFHRDLARGYLKAGKLDNAVDIYQRYLNTGVSDDSAWIELGEIYKKTGNKKLSAKAFESAYSINKSHQQYYYEASEYYLNGVDTTKATLILTNLYRAGYKNDKLILKLATIKYKKGSYSEAAKYAKELSSKFKSKQSVKEILAFSDFNDGNFSSALKSIQALLKVKPYDPDFVIMAGMCYDKLGKTQNAINQYKKYIKIKDAKNKKEQAFRLVELYEEANQLTNAQVQLKSNISNYPEDTRNHLKLLGYYMKSKKYQSVISLGKKTLSIKPSLDTVNIFMAESYSKLKQYSNSFNSYENYLKSNSKNVTVRKECALLAFKIDKYQKCIEHYNFLLGVSGGVKDDYYMLGECYYKLNDFKGASQYFNQALQADSTDLNTLKYLTDCYEALSDTASLILNLKSRIKHDKATYQLKKKLGVIYESKNNNDAAISLYETMLKANPKDLDIRKRLIDLYLAKKYVANAQKHLASALLTSPNNIEIRMQKAKCHIIQNEISDAKKELEKVISLKSNMHEARFMYAKLLKDQNKYIEALNQLKKACTYDKKNIKYLLATTSMALKAKQKKTAVIYIEKALKLEPKNSETIELAGLVYAANRNFIKAKGYLELAVISKSYSADCAYELGKIYFIEKNYKKAEPHLLYAIEKNIQNLDDALLMMGDVSYSQKKLRRAEDFYTKSFVNRDSDSELFFKLVKVCLEQNKIKEAQNLVKNSTKVKNDGWSAFARALVLETENKYEESWNALAIAGKFLPKNNDVIYAKGRIRYKQKKYKSALVHFNKLTSYKKGSSTYFYMVGNSHQKLMDYKNATIAFKKSLALNEKQPELYYSMGEMYEKKKDYKNAIKHYNKAVKFDPKSWQSYYNMAEIQRKLKDWNNSANNYLNAYKFSKKKDVGLEAYKKAGDIYFFKLSEPKKAKKNYKKYLKLGGNDKVIKNRVEKM